MVFSWFFRISPESLCLLIAKCLNLDLPTDGVPSISGLLDSISPLLAVSDKPHPSCILKISGSQEKIKWFPFEKTWADISVSRPFGTSWCTGMFNFLKWFVLSRECLRSQDSVFDSWGCLPMIQYSHICVKEKESNSKWIYRDFFLVVEFRSLETKLGMFWTWNVLATNLVDLVPDGLAIQSSNMKLYLRPEPLSTQQSRIFLISSGHWKEDPGTLNPIIVGSY